MYAQNLRLIAQARRQGFISITAQERQATDMLRPWLRSRKAPLFNMSPLLVQTKVLITAIARCKVEPFSAAVGFGAVMRTLDCGTGMVTFLRRPWAASSVVAFAINQLPPLTLCVIISDVRLRTTLLRSNTLE